MDSIRLIAATVVVLLPSTAMAWVGLDDDADPLYGWSDTEHPSDPDEPIYSLTSISSTGTSLSFSTSEHGPIDIGFDFEFYEEVYSQVYISSFGLVGFGPIGSAWEMGMMPDRSIPNNIIAGLWYSDFDTWSSTGYYETIGDAGSRQFIVQFQMRNWEWHSPSDTVFQVVLDEASGDIFVYVESARASWGSMFIGIENQDGTRGITSYGSSGMLTEYAAVFSFFGENPRIRVLTEDLTVGEGDSIDLEIEVTDRQDDAGEAYWDIDNDGEFDDAVGTTATLDASHYDGPATATPMIRVEDLAGNVRIATIPVEVLNLPPVFTNTPELEILRRQEWVYHAGLVDPREDDVITMVAEQRPVGMTVLADGGLRWVPTDDDVGEHQIRLVAFDDDDDPEVEGDGEAVLEFTLTVLDNAAPGIPTILRPEDGSVVTEPQPTFLVETPDDPEGDLIIINYDVDTVDTFTSDERIFGSIPANLGQTGWTLTQELQDETRYWLRVNATDQIEAGLYDVVTFTTDFGGADGDGDSDSDGDAEIDACACRATGSQTALGPMSMVLLLGAIFAFLRRNRF